MAIEIIDEIRQKNDGRFPVVDTNNVKGGFYQVNTVEERDQIPEERRRLGMLCFCKVGEEGAEDQLYQLKESGWEIASLGGGSGIKSVVSQAEMLEIKMEERQEGMLCYVKGNEKTYQLVGGIENEHWEIFSGGGTGGGGTVANLSCDTPHSNTGISDAPIVPAPSDAPVTIPFFFSSPNIGPGELNIIVSNAGATKKYEPIPIQQEPSSFTFPEPFGKSASTFNVTMWAVDRSGQQSNQVFIRYQVALLELSTSQENGRVVHTTTNIKFPYSISNALGKPIKVKKYLAYGKGEYELKSEHSVMNWSSIQYFEIGYLEIPGQYKVKIEVMTEDEEVKGNAIERTLIVASPDAPQIYTDEPEINTVTGETVRLKYRVAMSGKKELRVKGYRLLNGEEIFVMQKDVPVAQENEWVVGDSLTEGTHYFKMYVQTIPVGTEAIEGEIPLMFEVRVKQGGYAPVTPVEEGMIAQFVVTGETDNTSSDRDIWRNSRDLNGPHIALKNLNYTKADAWQIGSTQENTFLRLNGMGYAVMDYKPFEQDHDRANGEEIKGWTFEMLYRANNVGNEAAKVVNCVPAGSEIPGFYVTTQNASIGTKKGNFTTAVECDEWTHLAFVIHRDYKQEKNPDGTIGNVHLIFIYVNGVISRVGEIDEAQYASFENSENILFNCELNNFGLPTNYGSCDLKEVRIYNKALNYDEVIRNYFSTIKDKEKQKAEVEKNERGSQIPVLTVNRRTIGVDASGKPILEPFGRVEDKNKIRCHVEYKSLNGEFGQSMPNDLKLYPTSQIYYQGNSSLIYAKKNYKIRLRRFEDKHFTTDEHGQLVPPMTEDGYVNPTKASKWNYSPFEKGRESYPSGYTPWIEENTFTLKTNYMESSQASNAGSARYIHDMYRTGAVKRQTPPQKSKYSHMIEDQAFIRSTTNGFPIRLVLDGVDEGIHIMLVDKNSKNTYGVKSYKNPEDGSDIFKYPQSFEILANSDIGAGAFRKNDLESIHKEFEPRIAPPSTYRDNLQGTEKTYTFDEDAWCPIDLEGNFDEAEAQKAVPHHLMRMVNWVKEIGEQYEKGLAKAEKGKATSNDTLRKEGEAEAQAALDAFKNTIQGVNGKPDYFDEGYLIDYYLFALTFGMVDNFGKNVFLTTWDGRIWYPNFYDMDSMLGIDNQGKRNRDVDLEIDDKDEVGGYHFNTSQSLLWVLTRNAFKNEIKARYAELRDLKFFSYETAKKYYIEDFVERIPKRDYNRDAIHKYVDVSKAERTSYLEICSGDRRTYVSRWIKKRIIFMDSLMEYTGEYFNEMIALRANLEKAGFIEIPIKTTSPQYVSIEFTTGNIVRKKCYPHKDTIFRGEIRTMTNQEVNIGNAEFIKEIGNIKHLRISEIYLENASSLNKLDCSGSQMLKSLNIGPLKYLRELDCSGCVNLGTSDSNKGIDLSGCDNLMVLRASGTQLMSITFPKNGSPLTDLDITNCSKLETLHVTNQANLTSIPLDGCERLSDVIIQSCRMLERFNLPTMSDGKPSRVSSVVIEDCEKITSLTFASTAYLKFLTLSKMSGLRRIELSDLSKRELNPDPSSLQVALDLSNAVENVEEIIIRNCSIDGIKFSKTQEHHPLRRLTVNRSTFYKIGYGKDYDNSDSMDMKHLGNLEYLNISRSNAIIEVKNLNLDCHNPGELFRECTALRSISGNAKFTGNAAYLFYGCTSLRSTPTIDLSGITNATCAFERCHSLPPSEIPKILAALVNKKTGVSALQNASWMFRSCSLQSGESPASLPNLALSAEKFPDLTTIYTMFYDCSKIGGMLPGDLFGPASSTSNITNASNAFRGTRITGIHRDLLKPLKCVTDLSYLFHYTSLSGQIPEDLFANNQRVTTTHGMFEGCGNLTGGLKKRWFDDLSNVTNINYMFKGCGNLGNNSADALPDGLLASAKKVTTMREFLRGCSKISCVLPPNLLGGEEDETHRMRVRDLFGFMSGTKVKGNLSVNFFRRCPDLEIIGFDSTQATYDINCGIFYGTQLVNAFPTDHFGNSIFRYNPKLKYAGGAFRSCTSLNTELPEKLFKENLELLDVSYFLSGCTSLEIEIPGNIFDNNVKLKTAAGFFEDCPQVNGRIPNQIFRSLTNITDLSKFFKGCVRVGPEIPKDLFKGLTKLQKASGFFQGCTGLTAILPTSTYQYELIETQVNPDNPEERVEIYDWVLKEKSLFDDCENLTNVSNFFRECRKLTGTFPKFIFRQNKLLSNASGFFYNCNNLIGFIPVEIFEKNVNLIDASYCFFHCNKLAGYLPDGLFKNNISLSNVEGIFAWCKQLTKNPSEDVVTCLPSDLFSKCPLTNAARAFEGCSSLTGVLPPLFSFKNQLTKISNAFYSSGITGPVSDNFMNDCISLKEMDCLFEGCSGLTSISKGLLSDNMNIVTTAKHCFKGCSNVRGEVPNFQRQPMANKTGAFAGMTASNITNYFEIQNYTTPEVNHGHHDPYSGDQTEYID